MRRLSCIFLAVGFILDAVAMADVDMCQSQDPAPYLLSRLQKVILLRMRVFTSPFRHMASAARPLLRGVVFDLDGTLTVPSQASGSQRQAWPRAFKGSNGKAKGAQPGLPGDA